MNFENPRISDISELETESDDEYLLDSVTNDSVTSDDRFEEEIAEILFNLSSGSSSVFSIMGKFLFNSLNRFRLIVPETKGIIKSSDVLESMFSDGTL
ncbi:hypothetical protein T05_8039 [Trichinella murrelli]|uniref:Uncharacterized protein n=1 Tax=Trichinella murrelli TaxID=144512 RepID=A0A0V0TGE8_9BILA|nr:hypothetical protein T05_8039 [Trichinella murrelli]